MPMVKPWFVCFVFMGFVLGTLAAQDQRSAEKSHQVVLKYPGAAGGEITDGTTFVLIDPYLSRINGPAPPEEDRATPWLETHAGRMGGMTLLRRTLPLAVASVRVVLPEMLPGAIMPDYGPSGSYVPEQTFNDTGQKS
jgi:hypothetical protein